MKILLQHSRRWFRFCMFALLSLPAINLYAVCDIFPIAIEPFICDDNGTPGDPSDDTFSFLITMDAIDVFGTTYEATVNGNTTVGTYNVPFLIGPIPLSLAPLPMGFRDENNPNCVYTLYLDPGPNCSNLPCAVTSRFDNYVCDDNGTPNDPTDDVFFVDLITNGINTGPTWTCAGIFNGTGQFGVPQTFGPITVYTGITGVQVTDDANSDCYDFATLFSPGPCSSSCNLLDAGLVIIGCNDAGTPNIASDDYIDITLNPTGIDLGNEYIVTSNDCVVSPGIAPYGSPTAFTLSAISVPPGQTFSITITDADDPNCSIVLFNIFNITPCMPCEITDVIISDITCFTNGTSDPSDDEFTFNAAVEGNNTSSGWSANDPLNQTGPYYTVVMFGPYLISNGNITITWTDNDDPNCTFTQTIVPPPPCSTPPPCEIQATLFDLECDDNGTPNDPTDDLFYFEIVVNGTNTGSGWMADDPVNTTSLYGLAAPFGPYLISDGPFDLTFTDLDSVNCVDVITVTPPPPCSVPLCEIDATLSNVLCQDNGTPNDPTDDTYTFDLLVNGSNTGSGWSADDPANTTGAYGVVSTLGPLLISSGPFNLTVTDLDSTNCDDFILVEPPDPCSFPPCDITADIVDLLCDDNGTPGDPTDDTYMVDLLVTGNNTGSGWGADDPANTTGAYGVISTLGPFLILDGAFNLTITDLDSANCDDTILVEPPDPCSFPPCDITAEIVELLCDDNGTPGDPADDTYSFDLVVTGSNTGSGWSADDPANTTGAYGVISRLGPFLISDGSFNLTVTDLDSANCDDTILVEPPDPCSFPLCDITAEIVELLCDNNGTPGDPADDTYSFDLVVTGSNTGSGWSADDPANTTGTYGVISTLGPFLISDGPFNLTVTDLDSINCEDTILIDPPDPCSFPQCNITADVSNVLCDDNGTPNDPLDDTYTFDITVAGNNTGSGWSANDPNGTVGVYGIATNAGPYLIDDGPFNLTITDLDSISCTDVITVNPPDPCSTPLCNISAAEGNLLCDDNGTPNNSSDDTYTFDLVVTGNNTGSGWSADDPANTVGSYAINTTIGPLQISDGPFNLTVTDLDSVNCSEVINVIPPAPCSVPECRITADIINTFCDDNGTPGNTNDDTYSFNLIVTGSNTGSGWSADDPANSEGAYGTTTIFGPYSINTGPFTLIISDLDSAVCTDTIMVNPPPPCSTPQCNISAAEGNLLCDDNGTPNDSTDDTYTFDLLVTGTATGSGWRADDPANSEGAYGTTTIFGPYPISAGTFTLVISDLDSAVCADTVIVNAPATCSECTQTINQITESVCALRDVGTDTILLTTGEGCDSTVIITREYQPTEFISIDTAVCQNIGFIWLDGNLYNSDTVLVDTLLTSGCDTIRSTAVRIKMTQRDSSTLSICPGDSIIIDGVIYNEENTFGTDTLLDINGCDSIYRDYIVNIQPLELSIEFYPAICEGDSNSWFFSSETSQVNYPLNISINDQQETIVSELPTEVFSNLTGPINLVITDINGCQLDTSFVQEIPGGANIEITTDEIEANLLELTAAGAGNGSYEWILPQEDSMCEACPVIITPIFSDFLFELTYTTIDGCRSRAFLSWEFDNESNIYIPGAFSPNNDGINDVFTIYPYNTNYDEMELQIFDRWGSIVYESRQTEIPSWDGTRNGDLLSNGTYIYQLKVNIPDGTPLLYHGDLQLIR